MYPAGPHCAIRQNWRVAEVKGGTAGAPRSARSCPPKTCSRRGDTIRAPILETFSCEWARTASQGVSPHGAQRRRSTGTIKKPVSFEADQVGAETPQFFYLGPGDANPLAHPLVIALFAPLRRASAREPRDEEEDDGEDAEQDGRIAAPRPAVRHAHLLCDSTTVIARRIERA